MDSEDKFESWRTDKPKEKEFDASTIVYGLIFILYLILAIVLGVFIYRKNQRKQKREEQEEKERQVERERKMMEQQMMLLQQKQKLLELQAKTMRDEKVATSIDFKLNDIKETTFESPTEEEIKQLQQEPKTLDEKKES